MTSTAIRQRLITYLSDAEDNKIKAIYTLLENEIENEKSFSLTQEHLEILDKGRELHLNGATKSYCKQDAFDIIKGIKIYNVYYPIKACSHFNGKRCL